MESIGLFFIYALTAILMENALFARTLGVGQVAFFGSIKQILIHGGLLTLFTTLCSFVGYGVNYLLYDHTVSPALRSFFFLVGISLLYLAFYLGCDRLLPLRMRMVRRMLPISAFNCAVLGSMVLAVNMQHSLASTFGYGFGLSLIHI